MSKLIFSVLGVTFLALSTANTAHEKFSQYKAFETYEIRPGVLMIPRRSPGGQVCEIALERLHYTPDKISLDSSLSRKEIDQIFDELVPNDERGPQPKDVLKRGMTTFEGQGMVSEDEYRDVSIKIYGNTSPAGNDGVMVDEIVATLRWKNRQCR
jgi:hypothetical protein